MSWRYGFFERARRVAGHGHEAATAAGYLAVGIAALKAGQEGYQAIEGHFMGDTVAQTFDHALAVGTSVLTLIIMNRFGQGMIDGVHQTVDGILKALGGPAPQIGNEHHER